MEVRVAEGVYRTYGFVCQVIVDGDLLNCGENELNYQREYGDEQREEQHKTQTLCKSPELFVNFLGVAAERTELRSMNEGASALGAESLGVVVCDRLTGSFLFAALLCKVFARVNED